MKIQSIAKNLMLAAILTAGALLAVPNLSAQQAPAYPSPAPADKSAGQAAPPAAPKVDPQEEADYKAFYEVPATDNDKHIQLGEAFVQKYPNSKYTEGVYSTMAQAEYAKQDFPKMYADADKAIALNPDDVNVLIIVGWVIPHLADDASSPEKLDKAEKYEKHAIETLPTITKPANLTDEQFAKSKEADESQAHSGLGLVYYRKQNFEGAASEMTKATAGGNDPDPTDYYVLGKALKNLSKYSEAADAFDKCASMPGSLQGSCKQSADDAKKQAAVKPSPAKP
jgi:tetratricopeptide (TPR) repeat protein